MSRSTNPVSIEGLTVAEAAKYYGISNNAVRKRIQRGTINSKKINGQWRIYVDVPDEDESPADNDYSREDVIEVGETSVDSAMVVAEQQLTVFRAIFVAPLVHEIGELKYQLGSTENELGHVQQENQELRQRVIELESELNDTVEADDGELQTDEVDEPDTGPKWWHFWQY